MFKPVKTVILLSMLPLSALSFSAFASPVTLQATFDSQYNKYTGIGVLTFTYEDTTPADHIVGTTYPTGTYLNAVTSASFIFDNLSLTLNQTGINQIDVINDQGFTSLTVARIWLSFLDPSDTEYRIGFFISDSHHPTYDINLSNINGLQDSEGNTYLYAATDTSPYRVQSQNYIRQLSPLAPVPVPASLWLFGSGLLGLTGLSKRKK
jgi:hypothetical protein